LLFEGTPPLLDHGVRELQLRESQQPAQHARGDDFVDLGVHVLDACIRQHDWGGVGGRRASTGLEQHGHAGDRRERVGDSPPEDPAREVIDHRVQVGAGPVEQADHRGVDVPHLVGSCSSKAYLGLRWMHAEPRAPPAVRPHEMLPGRRGGPVLSEPLRKDSERAGRDVPVLGRGHHVPDRLDFG
jgi:hypothetical protein